MHFVSAKYAHVKWLEPQEAQIVEYGFFLNEGANVAIENCMSYTAVDGGDILAIGGVSRVEDHMFAWGVLSWKAKPFMLGITRKVKRTLRMPQRVPVRTCIRRDFPAGQKWANMLGFAPTGRTDQRYADTDLDVEVYELEGFSR